MRYADFLGFIAPEFHRPIADPGLTPGLLDTVHVTVAPPWATTMRDVIEHTRQFVEAVTLQGDRLHVAYTREYPEFPKTRVVLGLQHPPEDADTRALWAEGIRITCVAYSVKNAFGGGFADQSSGLMVAGEEFVRNCARTGLVVDLAHASHKTARDVLCLARNERLGLKVVATHTGCSSVYNHPRNLPDDVLRGIADLGGVVGVMSLTFALDKYDNDCGPFLSHLRYAVNTCGEGAVAIGGDGPYCMQPIGAWERNFDRMCRKLNAHGKFSPRFPTQPLEFNNVARMRVIEGLLGDFPKRVREKILGGNLLRFLFRALPERAH